MTKPIVDAIQPAVPQGKVYLCDVALIIERDGTVSAIVLNLPGAATCGDNEAEAMENIKDAVRGVVASYLNNGKAVPWKDSKHLGMPEGATIRKRILVNA